MHHHRTVEQRRQQDPSSNSTVDGPALGAAGARFRTGMTVYPQLSPFIPPFIYEYEKRCGAALHWGGYRWPLFLGTLRGQPTNRTNNDGAELRCYLFFCISLSIKINSGDHGEIMYKL